MNKFCKSCGKELEDNYKICPYCGEKIEDEKQIENIDKKEENTRVCQFCGKSINANFKICPYCSDKDSKISKKSGVVCLLLLIFLFPLWAHRLYAGKIGSAFFRIVLNCIALVLIALPMFYFASYFADIIANNKFEALHLVLEHVLNYGHVLKVEGMGMTAQIMAFFLYIGIAMLFVIFFMLMIDLIFIIVGEFKDADGKYIKTNN